MIQSIRNMMLVLTIMFTASQIVNAQSFLDKVSKGLDDATSAVTDATSVVTSAASYKINYDKVPVYSIKKVDVANEDGTTSTSYQLVDQNGNIRTPEAVKEQQKSLNTAIITILAKVGGGTALGAIAGGGNGALAGGAAGAIASIDDIKKAKDLKKTMSAQKKLIKEYEKNYTTEGTPKSAKVDTSSIESYSETPMAKTDYDKAIAAANDSSTDDFLSEEKTE